MLVQLIANENKGENPGLLVIRRHSLSRVQIQAPDSWEGKSMWAVLTPLPS